MAQVFISYARENLSFVKRLAKDLQKAGLDVWQDLSSLGGGDPWVERITAAIKESRFVIVVLSPHSVRSKWVVRELLFAEEHNRKIIPLLYRPCEVPINLRDVNYIDVQGENYENNFDELLQALDVNATRASSPIRVEPAQPFSGFQARQLALIGTAVFLAVTAIFWFNGQSLAPIETPAPVVTTPSDTQQIPTEPTWTEPPPTEPKPTDTATPTPTPTASQTPGPTPTDTPLPPIEPSSSAYTIHPPSIDGAMTLAFWKGAVKADTLPGIGNLYYLNDDQYLYLLVDVTGDENNNVYNNRSYDDLLLVFDVDKDKVQDSGDVYYSYSGKKVTFVFCIWADLVSDENCVIKRRDRSLTSWARSGFDISPADRQNKHKFWELRIDLDEIQGRLSEEIYAGVASRQYDERFLADTMRQFNDFSPDSFDFSSLIKIPLDEKPPDT